MSNTSLLKNSKNIFINSEMEIWQRNTTFPSIATNAYFADRFIYEKTGTMVQDINRSTDVPTVTQAGTKLNYSAFLNTTTAQATLGVGDSVMIAQRVEGYNIRNISGKNLFLSFMVKASKTGIYCASFRNGTSNRSYISEYTVNVSNTWEMKTIRLKHDTIGTWSYDNQLGLNVGWTIASGTTFQTTADSWQTGNFYATSNQVNGVDAVNNEFRIALPVLHEGIDQIPFNELSRSFSQEVSLCQRYFEKSYNIDVVVGTIGASGTVRAYTYQAVTSTINYMLVSMGFKTTKRIDPSCVPYSVSSGTPNTAGTGANASQPATAHGGTSTILIQPISTAGTNSNTASVEAHWTADAEL